MITVVIDGFAQAQRAPQGRVVNVRGRPTVIMYTPAEVRKWQFTAKKLAIEQMAGKTPMAGAITVSITVYLPLPKSMKKRDIPLALKEILVPITRPDCSNYCKAIEDAMNGVMWLDDSQISDLVVRKRYSDKPRVMIQVSEREFRPNEIQEALFDGPTK